MKPVESMGGSCHCLNTLGHCATTTGLLAQMGVCKGQAFKGTCFYLWPKVMAIDSTWPYCTGDINLV